ncbi:MAG: hypothetical protein EDQ89_04950 [Acidobacteria bacterium]|nr:MAG: hypothetical protein EDQ89_04950 [Acidobacteriota bacterium]MCL4288068.1 hypothetical protein [Thermoleophilia bacterium]
MTRTAGRRAGGAGQATVEWIGAVLLAAALLLLLATLAGDRLPGGALARTVAGALLCAVDSGRCDRVVPPGSAAEALYGPEIAALLERHAPTVFFEGGEFVTLPVDFRRCRERRCADAIRPGAVRATQAGLEPVAFTHVVDCRDPARAAVGGYDCTGAGGRIYLQYWLYYPESLTRGLGRLGGFHRDDWESFQVRIGPDGAAEARASSHHGYNGARGGIASIGSDTGLAPRPAWEPWTGALHVAAGSHAGTTVPGLDDSRMIDRGDLVLVPAETVATATGARFAVTPPWRKEVWRHPEAMGT